MFIRRSVADSAEEESTAADHGNSVTEKRVFRLKLKKGGKKG